MNGATEARPAAEDILDLDVVCSIQQTVTVGRGVAFEVVKSGNVGVAESTGRALT
jgi:hypothetical protein